MDLCFATPFIKPSTAPRLTILGRPLADGHAAYSVDSSNSFVLAGVSGTLDRPEFGAVSDPSAGPPHPKPTLTASLLGPGRTDELRVIRRPLRWASFALVLFILGVVLA
jgi:hypothetical protein